MPNRRRATSWASGGVGFAWCAGASQGYSLLELTFALGVLATLSAVAGPQLLTSVDDVRAAGAARYLSGRLHRARMEAVARSADVALQFVQTPDGYRYAEYRDGNGNGIRTRDIQRGLDPPVTAAERLPDQFAGVDFGVLPGLPAVDSGSTPLGTDPIKLGPSNILTFTALGTSSSGSLYIRGRRNIQYVIRVSGETGKVRVLKFDARGRQWLPS